MIGAITKCGNFSFRIDNWGFSESVNSAGSAEADAEPTGHDVSGADRTEHVVAAPGADEDVTQLKFFAQGRAQQTGRPSGGTERRKLGQQILVDEFGERFAPGTRPDIEQSGAGGVAVFHLSFASEPEIQKIMGQKNGPSMREVFRFVFFQPQDFRRGVAGHHGIACAANEFVDVSESAIYFFCLWRDRGIAPQL